MGFYTYLHSSQKFSNLGSQIGDERPISQVRFSPNNQILATGSWSGTVKLWNVPACTPIRSLRGHSDRVGGVAWHPQATLSHGPDLVNLVSGGTEGNVNMWSINWYVCYFLNSADRDSSGYQRITPLSHERSSGSRLSCGIPSFRRLCGQCKLRHNMETLGRKYRQGVVATRGAL